MEIISYGNGSGESGFSMLESGDGLSITIFN